MKSQAAESAHPIDAVPHQLDSVTLAGHRWSLQGLSPSGDISERWPKP
jgi:hypothetical protein